MTSTAASEQRVYIVEIGETRFGLTTAMNFTAKDLAQMLCGKVPVTPELPVVDVLALSIPEAQSGTNRANRRRKNRRGW